MFQKIETLRKRWTPADVEADETTALFDVSEGDRVVGASAKLLVSADASTDTTQTLGDGADPDGFVTSANLDLEGTPGAAVQGTGALLLASWGKLYTADDTIDVVYSNGTTPGATAPVVLYTVHILRRLR